MDQQPCSESEPFIASCDGRYLRGTRNRSWCPLIPKFVPLRTNRTGRRFSGPGLALGCHRGEPPGPPVSRNSCGISRHFLQVLDVALPHHRHAARYSSLEHGGRSRAYRSPTAFWSPMAVWGRYHSPSRTCRRRWRTPFSEVLVDHAPRPCRRVEIFSSCTMCNTARVAASSAVASFKGNASNATSMAYNNEVFTLERVFNLTIRTSSADHTIAHKTAAMSVDADPPCKRGAQAKAGTRSSLPFDSHSRSPRWPAFGLVCVGVQLIGKPL